MNTVLGILGLVLSLIAFYFTYITFVNPLIRFKKYLGHTEDWERFLGLEDHISIYRHKKHPEFQIVIDWDKEVVSGFKEEWVMDYPWRDRDNNCSYFVRLELNGLMLQREMFVGLDGYRYFVPVPRTYIVNDERFFYYDALQIRLAKIIGKFDYYRNIYEFVNQQKGLAVNEHL